MRWALYNLTSTTQSGGVETSVWQIGRALKECGHDVTVFGGEPDTGQALLNHGLAVRTFPYKHRDEFIDLGSRFRKFMERLSFVKQAGQALRQGGFDRVLLYKTYDLGPVLWALRGSVTKVGYLSGGAEFYPGYKHLAGRLDYLASVSAFNGSHMEKATGLKPEVNYLGVDGDIFYPKLASPEQRAAWGIGPDDLVMASAVRLVANKGLNRAVMALAELKDEFPSLKLLVAGSGPEEPKLKVLAEGLGVADRLIMVGRLAPEDLAGFYAQAVLGIFPSQGEEALGLAIGEAMACGLPVVASNLGGVPEVVGDKAGILTPPRDHMAVADAVAVLLRDPEKRRIMAEEGKMRIAEIFTWRACAQRLIQGMGN